MKTRAIIRQLRALAKTYKTKERMNKQQIRRQIRAITKKQIGKKKEGKTQRTKQKSNKLSNTQR